MKALRFYISLLIFAGFVSCQPEELPPAETGQPVFSVLGASVDITAGENDFYLFTDFEKDDLDVYSFIGRFAKTSDCTTDCAEELIIEIRNNEQTTGAGTIDINDALAIGDYAYKVANPASSNDMLLLDLTAEPEGTGPFIYKWVTSYNNNVDSFTTLTPNYSLTFENNVNVPYLSVCLTVNNNNDCEIEYCNTVNLNTNSASCQADFTVDSAPLLLQLTANMTNGASPYTYLWSTGSTAQDVVVQINGASDETYCVTITDASGCSDEICKIIKITPGTVPTVCASRFSYEKTIITGGLDSLQLGTVFIQYTDPTGVVYRSDLQQQSNSSYFMIISVEDYEDNENGEKTKKLTVSADCVLFNTNGETFNFPFEGVIAIAYPQ